MATTGKLHRTVKGCQLGAPKRSAQGKHSWSHWGLNTLYCLEIKRWKTGLCKRISHTRFCSNSQSWVSPPLPRDTGRKRNCALVWEAHFHRLKLFSPSWRYEGSQGALRRTQPPLLKYIILRLQRKRWYNDSKCIHTKQWKLNWHEGKQIELKKENRQIWNYTWGL